MESLNPQAPTVDTDCMKDSTDKPIRRLATPSVYCRSCRSPLVQAVKWEEQQESVWDIRLWCPECGFEQAATLDRSQLLYLSLAMEEGFAWVLEALAELDEISTCPDDLDFAHRVQTDRIQPAGC